MMRQMAGGNSRISANYDYNIAPQDGALLATADQAMRRRKNWFEGQLDNPERLVFIDKTWATRPATAPDGLAESLGAIQ